MPFIFQTIVNSISTIPPILAFLIVVIGTAHAQARPSAPANPSVPGIETTGTVILEGKITDTEKIVRPFEKIQVFLTPLEGEQFCVRCLTEPACEEKCQTCCPRSQFLSVDTDASGNYVAKFAGLKPGKYVLMNLKDRFSAGLKEIVEVKGGKTKTFETLLEIYAAPLKPK